MSFEVEPRGPAQNGDGRCARWADTAQRAAIIEQLAERGVDLQTVAAQAGKPDAAPFDLLCHGK